MGAKTVEGMVIVPLVMSGFTKTVIYRIAFPKCIEITIEITFSSFTPDDWDLSTRRSASLNFCNQWIAFRNFVRKDFEVRSTIVLSLQRGATTFLNLWNTGLLNRLVFWSIPVSGSSFAKIEAFDIVSSLSPVRPNRVSCFGVLSDSRELFSIMLSEDKKRLLPYGKRSMGTPRISMRRWCAVFRKRWKTWIKPKHQESGQNLVKYPAFPDKAAFHWAWKDWNLMHGCRII